MGRVSSLLSITELISKRPNISFQDSLPLKSELFFFPLCPLLHKRIPRYVQESASLVLEVNSDSHRHLSLTFYSSKSGIGKLFCKGQIINIFIFLGQMVSVVTYTTLLKETIDNR
jgi:hypothetical protein